jgi:AraC-like DNA-binding protein
MKKQTIKIISHKKFATDYFDYEAIRKYEVDVKKLVPQEDCCIFSISSIQASRQYINFPKDSFKSTFYTLLFITKGFCRATDNLNVITQKQNQIRFTGPGKVTSVVELSEDIEGFHCLFDQEFIDTYSGKSGLLNSLPFFDLDALSVIELPAPIADFFKVVLSKLLIDFSNDYANLKSAICQYLVGILTECEHYYTNEVQDIKSLLSADKISYQFVKLVNTHYLTKRNLADYAELLHITPQHLTKCIKQATGKTPTAYINQMLVLEAKVLLKETRLTISEIAYQLNFEDPAYFNRFFKKHAAQTPSMFRKLA